MLLARPGAWVVLPLLRLWRTHGHGLGLANGRLRTDQSAADADRQPQEVPNQARAAAPAPTALASVSKPSEETARPLPAAYAAPVAARPTPNAATVEQR